MQKFVAACRRQWPGAKIVLRPYEGGPPQGANAPPNQAKPISTFATARNSCRRPNSATRKSAHAS
jgi:hypothetical protein